MLCPTTAAGVTPSDASSRCSPTCTAKTSGCATSVRSRRPGSERSSSTIDQPHSGAASASQASTASRKIGSQIEQVGAHARPLGALAREDEDELVRAELARRVGDRAQPGGELGPVRARDCRAHVVVLAARRRRAGDERGVARCHVELRREPRRARGEPV